VSRERAESFEAALELVESRGRELERTARAAPVDTKIMGRFEPVQQVAARIELSGPGRVRAGVDVRGDGSAEAFVGRVRRHVVERRGKESVYAALRRVVGGR
jgi:hypothetical protein